MDKQKESPKKRKIASPHRTKENEQTWRIFRMEMVLKNIYISRTVINPTSNQMEGSI